MTLTLASDITSGQTVTLDYEAPATDPLRDESELHAPGFTGVTVTNNTGASTDATLSDLDLTWDDDGIETGIALNPAFDTAEQSYTASVAYQVSRITVKPTFSDDNATPAFFDETDTELDDADGDAMNGFQVDLAEGATAIKVKVTAENGIATETYTVTVTRAAGTILVSSLGQSDDGTTSIGGASGRIVAQRFTVALNHETVLSDVTVGGAVGEGVTVAIHEPAAGNANNPAEASLYDLTRTGADGSDGIFYRTAERRIDPGRRLFRRGQGSRGKFPNRKHHHFRQPDRRIGLDHRRFIQGDAYRSWMVG